MVVDQLPRLGKRELVCLLLFTCNYVVSVWRGFLFLWVLGMGYVILFWHALSLPYNYFKCNANPSTQLRKTNHSHICLLLHEIRAKFLLSIICIYMSITHKIKLIAINNKWDIKTPRFINHRLPPIYCSDRSAQLV